jgi:CDP-glucose 4,6-dehydratase
MNIAITGATGLLGAHLSNELLEGGHNVYGLIRDENSKSILSRGVNRIYGDISLKADVEYFVQKSNPDVFIHLAAQTQAYDSLTYPYQTFYNNIVGTLNVMEALREFKKTQAIIVASSDKAYGELIGEEYFENHPLMGVYPYDASKSATDLVVHSYRSTYSMPAVTTRACNIYGSGEFNKQRLIPAIVLAAHKKGEFVMRNGGTDIREYINVSDVVSAYLRIIEYVKTQNSEAAFNISSGERYSTKQILELLGSVIGKEVPTVVDNNATHEIRKQFMNSDLLRKLTGWAPRTTMPESLPDIADWCAQNL